MNWGRAKRRKLREERRRNGNQEEKEEDNAVTEIGRGWLGLGGLRKNEGVSQVLKVLRGSGVRCSTTR